MGMIHGGWLVARILKREVPYGHDPRRLARR